MMQTFILTYLTYEFLSGFHTYYVEGFVVYGCFWVDNNNGMAAFQKKTSDKPTTVSCLEFCRNVNYNYAASKLDASGRFECYCGNDIQFTTKVSGLECGFSCPVTVTDVCGRNNRMAVYNIQGESLPIVLPVLEPATKMPTSQEQPTTEVSTSTVKPTTRVSRSSVQPTTEVSTSTVQPTTEVSTSTVEHTTFMAPYKVERLSTTSAVNDMTSIDDDKTTTVSIGSEKTSHTTTFVQSTEISTKVAELPVSTSIEETISTHNTKSGLSVSTTAVETVSSSSNFKNPSISNQMQCTCPCASVSSKWNFLANMNMSIAELKIYLNDYLDELKQNLTIDKTKTSAYINTKISAPDDRKSSVSIGYFGIVLVGIPIAFILCSDAMRFAMQIQKRKL
ncbi:uncharacterized protein LOC134709548 [Mytilus trossulus]|uniref:uncharacterized protein LOC134709548 n=1 Tax=Mytilus trossulus TaxID=6551 RepID=UPI00300438B3